MSHPKRSSDVVNNFGIVLIGLTSAILLWVSIVALQAYYGSTAGEIEEQRTATDLGREMRELKAAQAAALQEWKWVDQKKGTVTVSIDHAMAAVVRDARGGAASLVPAVGAHDQPTVPAEPGRPADDVAVPGGAAPAPGGELPLPAPGTPAPPPSDGTTPAEGGNTDQPSGGLPGN
jgi:hypothetical protein